MIELVKNEALWFPSALVVAALTTAILVVRLHRAGVARRVATARALSVYYGCVIGIMGTGHLLVVTIRAIEGTLSHGVRWFLYPLGLVIAVPAWFLVASTTMRRMTIGNCCLAAVMIAQGASAPLAVPALLNLAYIRFASPAVTRTIVAVSLVLYVGLFSAALVLGGGNF